MAENKATEVKSAEKAPRPHVAGVISPEAFELFEDYRWSNRLKKSEALDAIITAHLAGK